MAAGPADRAPQKPAKVISGGIWTMVERVISQAAQLIIFIAAARILSPAEFGTFALVSACAILLLRVAEVGWAQYIMSWHGDDTVPRQVLFIAMLSGVVMAAIGVLSGFVAPLLGLDGTIGVLIIAFSGWVFLATTSSAQKGMMIWQGKLRWSAAAEILGELAGLAAALSALYAGWGVLALAAGRLAMQSVHLFVSFCATRLTPKPGMSAKERKALLTFSAQLFSSRLIINLRLYLATFIIGGFLGPAAVGYYRAAERLVGAMAEIVSVPGEVLAWSLFRTTRDSRPEGTAPTVGFQKQANFFYRMLMAVALPLFIWLALLGEDVVTGLLGKEWLPALPVIAILALARALIVPGIATEPVLSIAGSIRHLPRFTLILFGVTIVATLAAAPFGLYAVAWAQVLVGAVILIATVPLLRRHGGIDLIEVLRRAYRLIPPLLLGAAVLYMLRDAAALADWNPLLRAVAVSIPAVALYVSALVAMDPRLRGVALQRVKMRLTERSRQKG